MKARRMPSYGSGQPRSGILPPQHITPSFLGALHYLVHDSFGLAEFPTSASSSFGRFSWVVARHRRECTGITCLILIPALSVIKPRRHCLILIPALSVIKPRRHLITYSYTECIAARCGSKFCDQLGCGTFGARDPRSAGQNGGCVSETQYQLHVVVSLMP
jgi:hypothetical protein